MAQAARGPRAVWTVKCVEALLAFLVENKASAGDGANFKSTTWQGAASHVNAIRKEGAAKTKESCRAKFKAVRIVNFHDCRDSWQPSLAQGNISDRQGNPRQFRLALGRRTGRLY